MQEELPIDTPEQIALHYDIAGIGSRFCAAIIDFIILTLIMVAGMFVISNLGLVNIFNQKFNNWLIALLNMIIFALSWGYYTFFEFISNGQSPGKRLLKIRVITEGGSSVSFAASVIRNLVRIVDFLPVLYGVGMIVMMLDTKWRRLGDIAAGTLVIKEHTELSPTQFGPYVATKTHFTYADRIQLDQVTARKLSLIREYLSRRHTLPATPQYELARAIAKPIAEKMGIDERIFPNYDTFLEEVFLLVTSPPKK
jgi:uncharacterized RDD family membrane protein YckC